MTRLSDVMAGSPRKLFRSSFTTNIVCFTAFVAEIPFELTLMCDLWDLVASLGLANLASQFISEHFCHFHPSVDFELFFDWFKTIFH